jgi:hypothetical protein
MNQAVMQDQTDRSQADLWLSGIFPWTAKEKELLPEIREKLRSYDSDLGRYLADVSADSEPGEFRVPDISKLEKLVIKDYGKNGSIRYLRILDKVILHLNRKYQKSIPRPRHLKNLEQDANVFLEGNATAHQSVHEWLKADAHWSYGWIGRKGIAGIKIDRPPHFNWEMVIVSAALHCGIVSLDSAVALVDALCDPRQYFACSEIRAYADLRLHLNTGKDVLIRRWYPDDLLLLLMSKINPVSVRSAIGAYDNLTPRKRKQLIGGVILNEFAAELRRQRIATTFLPESFPVLLERIEKALRSEIAATLVNFATGDQPARPLLPASIGRIYGDPAAPSALVKLPPIEPTENGKPEPDNPEAYERDATELEQKEPEWLRMFRDFFNSPRNEDIELALQKLDGFPNTLPPVATHLRSLLRKLVTDCASTGNEWAIASAKCCILTVARRFGIARKTEDPATYSAETLLELYREARDRAAEASAKSPARLQRTVAWALREYQRHIVCSFGANPINEAIAFRVEPGILPVNARVLSIDDLFDIIQYIKTAPCENWLPKYRKLAIAETLLATLGGVRRDEGLGLDSMDHLPSLVGLLLVRDNESRTLKTANAKRALYLSIMAYPFTELVEYVSELFEESQGAAGPVFANVSDDVIIPIIHKAIEKVTGDAGCTLHTMRHSFGHWMFFRLNLAAQFDPIPDLFPHLERTKAWLQASREFRELLYQNGNGLVENDHAWATAVELGHSAPESVTIPHYVHCADILLALTLERNRVFGVEAIERLWAAEKDGKKKGVRADYSPDLLSYPTLYAQTRHSDGPRLQKRVNSISQGTPRPREVFRRAFDLDVLEHERTEAQPETFGWLEATDNALYLAGVLGMPLPAIAETTGLDNESIIRILRNVEETARMKSHHAGTTLHPMVAFRGSSTSSDDTFKSYHPLRPRGELAAELISKFADNVDRFVESEGEIAQRTIGYVARNMLAGRPCVTYLTPVPEMLSNCLDLFRCLGFSLEKMAGYSSDGTARRSPTENWLKKWGLSRRWKAVVVNQHGRERLLQRPDEWLVLEPATLGEDQQSSGQLWKRVLRYVLVMAFLRFGV